MEEHGGIMQEQYPDRNCSLWSRAGGLTGTVANGVPMLEQSIPKGLHCVERIYAGTVIEELHLVVRTHAGEVCEGLYSVGRISC